MQAAYERGEEKVKVLDETAMTGVVRRAGCVCHSGSKDTHKISGIFFCHCQCMKGNLTNSNSNHQFAHNK